MIRLLPYESETLVLSCSRETLLEKIYRSIHSPAAEIAQSLTGWLTEDKFQLTIRLRRQHGFMPVVSGRIDPTNKGCLLFLDYTLFPATKMFLIFWSLLIFLGGGVTAYQYQSPYLMLAAIALIALIHWIAWANFRLHLKTTRDLLMKLLPDES